MATKFRRGGLRSHLVLEHGRSDLPSIYPSRVTFHKELHRYGLGTDYRSHSHPGGPYGRLGTPGQSRRKLEHPNREHSHRRGGRLVRCTRRG